MDTEFVQSDLRTALVDMPSDPATSVVQDRHPLAPAAVEVDPELADRSHTAGADEQPRKQVSTSPHLSRGDFG
jgi:hypothetical protein